MLISTKDDSRSLDQVVVSGGCKILIRGSVIGFSSLSVSNSLTNQVLNKNIKIISFVY
jgi:hypothetical protein